MDSNSNFWNPKEVESVKELGISPNEFYFVVEAHTSDKVKNEIHKVLSSNISKEDKKAYINRTAETTDGTLLREKYIEIIKNWDYEKYYNKTEEQYKEIRAIKEVAELIHLDEYEKEYKYSKKLIEEIFDEFLPTKNMYHESKIVITDEKKFEKFLRDTLHLTPNWYTDILKKIVERGITKPVKIWVKLNDSIIQLTLNRIWVMEIPLNSKTKKYISYCILRILFDKSYISNEVLSFDHIDLAQIDGSWITKDWWEKEFKLDEDF